MFMSNLKCFAGEYFRKNLDGYSLNDLSDLVSRIDVHVSKILDRFCEELSTEVFVLFNYNHFGPVALVFTPSERKHPKLLIGYPVWDFSHYHYRYFLGHGIHSIHPRYNTPNMFYPYIRGSFEVGEVILACMFEFANQFEVTKSLSRKILNLISGFERGFFYTLTGKTPVGMGDIFSEILYLVRKKYGRQGYEILVKLFLEHRIYYQPVILCEEFRKPLELIQQFLYSLDDKIDGLELEKYLLSLGFRKHPTDIQK